MIQLINQKMRYQRILLRWSKEQKWLTRVSLPFSDVITEQETLGMIFFALFSYLNPFPNWSTQRLLFGLPLVFFPKTSFSLPLRPHLLKFPKWILAPIVEKQESIAVYSPKQLWNKQKKSTPDGENNHKLCSINLLVISKAWINYSEKVQVTWIHYSEIRKKCLYSK